MLTIRPNSFRPVPAFLFTAVCYPPDCELPRARFPRWGRSEGQTALKALTTANLRLPEDAILSFSVHFSFSIANLHGKCKKKYRIAFLDYLV